MTDKMTYKEWREKTFPGKYFLSQDMKEAGQKYKKDPVLAGEFLSGRCYDNPPPDARPPAKCRIVALSRPLEEWPIARASAAVQRCVYALPEGHPLLDKMPVSKPDQQAWLQSAGLTHEVGEQHVQGMALVFKNAWKTYEGVVKKAANRHAKRVKQAEKRKKSAPEPDPVYGGDGRLLNPPGVNPAIFCYQQISPKPVTDKTYLPPEYAGYSRDPDAMIEGPVPVDRLSIPERSPGYVPAHDRSNLTGSKHRRMRAYYASAKDKRMAALLVKVRCGQDWALIDARGLLRNARWRGLPCNTLRELLALFTGDPVLHPRGEATFIYKPGVVPVRKRKVYGAKGGAGFLRDAGTVGLVSVDLGANNPAAVGVYRVTDGVPERLAGTFLPEDQLTDIARYRRAHDSAVARMQEASILALTPEQQAEIRTAEQYQGEVTKLAVCHKYGLGVEDVAWGRVRGGSTLIAEAYLRQGGDRELVTWQEGKLLSDARIARDLRAKVSADTRKAQREALYEEQRKSPEWRRLSQRKKELARQCANWMLRQGQKLTQCEIVAMAVEDLNLRMFHGSGARGTGWDALFAHKRENRWMMQALHGAITDLAPHRGVPVIAVPAQHTSQACIRCGHCEAANRSGERFACVSCGWIGHADLEVATENIARVAARGCALKRKKQEKKGVNQVAQVDRSQTGCYAGETTAEIAAE